MIGHTIYERAYHLKIFYHLWEFILFRVWLKAYSIFCSLCELQSDVNRLLGSSNYRLDLLSPPCTAFWSFTLNNATDPYLPKNVTKFIKGTEPLALYWTRVSTCKMLKIMGIDDDGFMWKWVRIYKSKVYTHHSSLLGSFLVGVHRHMDTFTFSSHQWLASFLFNFVVQCDTCDKNSSNFLCIN